MESSASGQDDQIPRCDSLPHPFSSRNMLLPKSELVHESFLSQNILRDSKKISVSSLSGRNKKTRKPKASTRTKTKKTKLLLRFSSIFSVFCNKNRQTQKWNTKRHEGLECYIISPRSLFACIWTETKSRSIKTQNEIKLALGQLFPPSMLVSGLFTGLVLLCVWWRYHSGTVWQACFYYYDCSKKTSVCHIQ